jgi:hypothetical protein
VAIASIPSTGAVLLDGALEGIAESTKKYYKKPISDKTEDEEQNKLLASLNEIENLHEEYTRFEKESVIVASEMVKILKSGVIEQKIDSLEKESNILGNPVVKLTNDIGKIIIDAFLKDTPKFEHEKAKIIAERFTDFIYEIYEDNQKEVLNAGKVLSDKQVTQSQNIEKPSSSLKQPSKEKQL